MKFIYCLKTFNINSCIVTKAYNDCSARIRRKAASTLEEHRATWKFIIVSFCSRTLVNKL